MVGQDRQFMKIAVCFSGIVRGNIERNIKSAKMHFGDNVFFSTWKGLARDKFDDLGCSYFDEPKIHYNPWMECEVESPHPKYKAYKRDFLSGKSMNSKLVHASKQIVGHAHQLKHQVPEEYDLIVRTRWDTFISKNVDFKEYIKYAYEEEASVGFSIRGNRHSNVHRMVEIPKVYPKKKQDGSVSNDWGWWLNDNLIIHHRNRFDSDKVFDMYENKQLLPAEYGWYQVLSQPKDDHLSIYGGACIERYVSK